MAAPEKVLTFVGAARQLVDYDLFVDVHEQLSEHFRSLGFTGCKLDDAIVAALPDALEQALYGDRGTIH